MRSAKVSIPFKREGTWKVIGTKLTIFRYYKVSIPFKREGTWKDGTQTRMAKVLTLFQFPSNGKVHGKFKRYNLHVWCERVSIPFKREGTWKAELTSFEDPEALVSIPFKREGTWKATLIGEHNVELGRVVSIPFKREGTWKVILWATG